MIVNYHKRKNEPLFKQLNDIESLHIVNIQNYNPIYKRLFVLNNTNYNSINLNHDWYITNIHDNNNTSHNIYECQIKHATTKKTKTKDVFFKFAPLLDPFKYLTGKYDINETTLFNLPTDPYEPIVCHKKIEGVNNCSYIDSFFSFLSSTLIQSHAFIHGVDFYGSFLGIKHNYILNIDDDIEYIADNPFFKKHNNSLFSIKYNDTDYPLLQKPKLNINFSDNVSCHNLSIKSVNCVDFDNLFNELEPDEKEAGGPADLNYINFNELKELSIDLLNITHSDEIVKHSTSSHTSFSSRTSNTSNSEETKSIQSDHTPDTHEETASDMSDGDETLETESDDTSYFEDDIKATIFKFPVQIICMEKCEDTLDSFILNNSISEEEWFSILMQVIMILIIYQQAFHFTHNDLHTNNVMYSKTDIKYVYYLYKNKYYKVPTFGKIFKIIDFGRSIYKYNKNIFCSDSFDKNEDAYGQYNTLPYLNEKKPTLDPNPSFDLCRLACSIFDYVVDDMSEIKDLSACSPIVRLIVEWCQDDKGSNVLYKQCGADRYPDFKLYKMIARGVHKHTPQKQVERSEFKKYVIPKYKHEKNHTFINIDKIPCY